MNNGKEITFLGDPSCRSDMFVVFFFLSLFSLKLQYITTCMYNAIPLMYKMYDNKKYHMADAIYMFLPNLLRCLLLGINQMMKIFLNPYYRQE